MLGKEIVTGFQIKKKIQPRKNFDEGTPMAGVTVFLTLGGGLGMRRYNPVSSLFSRSFSIKQSVHRMQASRNLVRIKENC